MITTPEEFKAKLLEIQNEKTTFTTLPSTEPRFVIDANTREISIPSGFSFLGVKHDHRAETIYFEIDRYYDDVDLSQYTCIIQFTNGIGAEISEGIDHSTEFDLVTVDGKIIFGWEIKNDVTRYAGNILFSVRFFSIDSYKGTFSYNFNTTSKTLKILDTLEVFDGHTSIEPSILVYWENRMDELNRVIASDISRYTAEMIALSETTKTYSDETKLLHNEVLNIKNDIPVSLANGIAEINQATESAKVDIANKAVEALATIPEDYAQIDADVKVLKKQDIRNSARFSNALIGKASGTGIITVNDSAESAIPSLDIFGKSEQMTTTGANLFDASRISSATKGEVTLTNNGDGGFTISGTGNITSVFNHRIKYTHEETINLLKVGNYYTSKLNVYPYCFVLLFGTGVNKQITSMSIIPLSITQADLDVPDLTLTIGFYGEVGKSIVSGIIKPMLWMKNTPPTEADWQPYTGGIPSPSPDYPQEIKSIGDSGKLDLMVTGTNLLDQETVLTSIGFVKQSDGSFYVKNNNTVYGKHVWDNVIGYQGQITLMYDYKFLDSGISTGTSFNIILSDGTRTSGNPYITTSWSAKIIVSDSNKLVEFIDCNYGTNLNSTWIRNMAIYLGAISNPVYTPYRSQSIHIPLTEPLRAIANVRDRITLKDGVWGIERNVGEIIFDGGEDWKKYGNNNSGTSFFIKSDKFAIGYQTSICNMFQNQNVSFASGSFGKVGIYSDHESVQEKYFRPPNSNITTVEQFQAWLAEHYTEGNQVKLVYKLNSIYWTFEPFDQATQDKLNALTTYQGTTNIMVNDENPDMAVEYVHDINMVVKELVDRIAVLEGNLLT